MALEKMKGDFSDYRRVLGVNGQVFGDLLGVTQSYVSKLESGEKPATEKIIEKCQELIKGSEKLPKMKKTGGHKNGNNMTGNMTPCKAPKSDVLIPIFKEAYQREYGSPYEEKDYECINLNKLRSRQGELLTVESWSIAAANYLATPQRSHTLNQLANEFDTFKLHSLDRFGKPASKGQGVVSDKTMAGLPALDDWARERMSRDE